MRSCIYCGKELKEGEQCDCPQSAAHRKAKAEKTADAQSGTKAGTANDNSGFDGTNGTYRTGYTKKESKIKHAWDRHKMKQRVKCNNTNAKSFFANLFAVIKRFILSPVDMIMNPTDIGKGGVIAISAAMGAVISLCVYFIMSNVRRGPFALLASLLAFNGTGGYINLANMFMAVLSGAVTGIILFFVYSGIFYGINRLIFKLRTPFWDFSQRLVLTGIPMTVLGVIGAVFSIFSSTALMILLLCGAVSWIVLTYEALKSEWISKPAGKIMYAMMLGFYVFFSMVCYLIRLS